MDKAIRWALTGAGLLAVAIIAGLGAIVYFDVTDIARDIALIVLAVFMVIATVMTIVLLLVLIYGIRSITGLINTAVLPRINDLTTKANEIMETTQGIAERARDSTEVVTGTTTFVAERVAAPVIRVSSVLTGIRAAAGAFARRDMPEQPYPPEIPSTYPPDAPSGRGRDTEPL